MVLVAVSIHAKSMHRVTATGSCISVKTTLLRMTAEEILSPDSGELHLEQPI